MFHSTMQIPVDARDHNRLLILSQLMALSAPVLSPVLTLMLTQDVAARVSSARF